MFRHKLLSLYRRTCTSLNTSAREVHGLMRPIRYTDDMIDEFRSQGLWTDETFADYWLKNARERPDKEALVDSTHASNVGGGG